MLGALLNGCITINHGNLELAETVAEKLVELRPQNDGRYMELANVYATNIMAWSTREAMEKKGVKKIAVNSIIIELNGNTTDSKLMTKHIFDSEEIYSALHLDGSQC